MKHLTPIKTTPYGHTLSRYDGGDYQGYAVTAKIDAKEYTYDFMDSLELALEYREALEKAFVTWLRAVDVAEMAIVGIEEKWEAAGTLRKNYELLVTHAKYPRWESVDELEVDYDLGGFSYDSDDLWGAMHP